MLVEHQTESNVNLPIADVGNQYYENGEPITNQGDKITAKYKADSEIDKRAYVQLNEKYKSYDKYIYNNKIKVIMYRGSESNPFSYEYVSSSGKVYINPKKLADNGYNSIKIIYYYENQEPSPTPMDFEFTPTFCTQLRFSYANNKREDCMPKINLLEHSETCLDSSYGTNDMLYLPTNQDFNANVTTTKYVVDDKTGIIQKISTYTVDERIVISHKKRNVTSSDFTPICEENKRRMYNCWKQNNWRITRNTGCGYN